MTTTDITTTTEFPADQYPDHVRRLVAPRRWYGPSGLPVTGEAVAGHLEAAARLMERDAWDPQLYGTHSGRTLWDAMISTRDDGLGDEDTRVVACEVLRTVLEAVMGAPYVCYETWAEHRTRTLAEVLAACRLAAHTARQYSPS